MANPRARSRNTVQAGLLTMVSLALFVIWVMALGNVLELMQPKSTYVIDFDLETGTQGLDIGSIVQVGGQPVGRVKALHRDMSRGTHGVIEVTIAVSPDLVIYENADPELIRPLLGSGAMINFPTLGNAEEIKTPENGDPLLQADLGERLHGELAPGLLAQAGFNADDIERFRNIMENINNITDRVDNMTEQVEENFPQGLDEAKSVISNISRVVSDFRKQWPDWRDRISSIVDKTDRITANAEDITTNVNEGVSDARSVISTVQNEIDKASPKVQQALDNIREGTGVGKDQLLALIEKANSGLDSYINTGNNLENMTREEMPNVHRVLANSRLATEQLKLTMMEIRRAPWRVLYRPKQRELENELLYDAARSYAQAVSDLWDASNSLREAVETENIGNPADKQRLNELLIQMEGALAKYNEKERIFLNKLKEN